MDKIAYPVVSVMVCWEELNCLWYKILIEFLECTFRPVLSACCIALFVLSKYFVLSDFVKLSLQTILGFNHAFYHFVLVFVD